MNAMVEVGGAVSAAERGTPMRALLQAGYGSFDVFRVGELPRPSAGEGEVVLYVRAAGVDRGTWHMMVGRPHLIRLLGFGFWRPKAPVPGLDVAGTVVEVGPNVTRFRVGDPVFGLAKGSMADYAVAREDKLSHMPSRLGFEQAAVLGVSGSTALQGVQKGELAAHERVLITGAAGGVGSYAVQIAKALGAHVTAVCSTSKSDFVRSLGADHVIDYTREDYTAGAQRYDLILDIAGGTPVSHFRRVLTDTGRLVFMGNEHASDWSAGFERQLGGALLGLFVRQRFIGLLNEEHHRWLDQLKELVEAGKLSPPIDRICQLQEVPEALRALEQGAIRGKIAVSIAGDRAACAT